MFKICNSCGEKKEITLFHKDSKNKDGYSASCGACRNAKRRNRTKLAPAKNFDLVGTNLPKIDLETSDVPPEVKAEKQERDIKLLLKKVQEKHQAHFSLSMDRKGNYRLQTHGSVQHAWKGTDIIDILNRAIA